MLLQDWKILGIPGSPAQELLYEVTAFLLTSLASMTVPTPTVKAIVGTLERSPSKNLALAKIVSIAKVFTRVLDTKLDPGSLKAM